MKQVKALDDNVTNGKSDLAWIYVEATIGRPKERRSSRPVHIGEEKECAKNGSRKSEEQVWTLRIWYPNTLALLPPAPSTYTC